MRNVNVFVQCSMKVWGEIISSKKPDIDKIKTILNTLRKYNEGLWLRKLSRECGIPVSTLHYYLDYYLDDLITSKGAKKKDGRYLGIRVIELKSGVKAKLENGVPLTKILKTKQILDSD